MKRTLAAWLFLALGGALAAACGGSSRAPTPTPEGPAAASTASATARTSPTWTPTIPPTLTPTPSPTPLPREFRFSARGPVVFYRTQPNPVRDFEPNPRQAVVALDQLTGKELGRLGLDQQDLGYVYLARVWDPYLVVAGSRKVIRHDLRTGEQIVLHESGGAVGQGLTTATLTYGGLLALGEQFDATYRSALFVYNVADGRLLDRLDSAALPADVMGYIAGRISLRADGTGAVFAMGFPSEGPNTAVDYRFGRAPAVLTHGRSWHYLLPDGRYILKTDRLPCGDWTADHSLSLIDLDTNLPVASLQDPDMLFGAIGWAPSGVEVVVAAWEGGCEAVALEPSSVYLVRPGSISPIELGTVRELAEAWRGARVLTLDCPDAPDPVVDIYHLFWRDERSCYTGPGSVLLNGRLVGNATTIWPAGVLR